MEEKNTDSGCYSIASDKSDQAKDGGHFLYWDPHGRHSKLTASSGSLQHSKVTDGSGSLQHCKVRAGGTQQEKTTSNYSSLIDEKKPTREIMQKELNDYIYVRRKTVTSNMTITIKWS